MIRLWSGYRAWRRDVAERNYRGPPMPPLPESRREMYRFYRMQFLPDGYPGKRTERGLVPHPILGTYVIRDYLTQHERTGDRTFLDAAVKVADAAIARMQPFHGSLVFNYTGGMGLTTKGGTFYSGLTQGRYLQPLARLWKISGEDRFLEAAEKVLASLEIPVSMGGVARPAAGGIVIEEYPDVELRHYTLNGWTTTMVELVGYAGLTGSKPAAALLQANVVALKALLPFYDMPEMANSRYRLTGQTWLRLEADAPLTFGEGSLEVPGEGSFPIRRDTADPWQNFVARRHRRVRRLDVSIVMSRVSHPEENRVHLRLAAARKTGVRVSIETGDYDHLNNRPKKRRFAELPPLSLAPGENDVVVPIPWSAVPLIAYPTNFGKKIGTNHYNVYHFIHIRNLDELHAHTGEPLLKDYADRWRAYVDAWPTMPVYAGTGAVLHPYRAGG